MHPSFKRKNWGMKKKGSTCHKKQTNAIENKLASTKSAANEIKKKTPISQISEKK